MRSRTLPLVLVLVCVAVSPSAVVFTQTQSPPAAAWLAPLREDAARLMKAAMADDFAWQRVAELTDTFGSRLTGSDNLQRAIDWAVAAMKADGLENVHTEPVMVPRWIRGHESAVIVDPPRHELAILGLGGTVATPPGGIEAEVLPVTSFDDLREKQAQVRGRIVLFDVPYSTYYETVTYRTAGRSEERRVGNGGRWRRTPRRRQSQQIELS